jgi:hypothetical protein
MAGRLRFTRDLGNIVMDVDDTERGDLKALGGQDATNGVADAVTVNGTNGPDNIAVAANGGVVDVTGLFTAIGDQPLGGCERLARNQGARR